MSLRLAITQRLKTFGVLSLLSGFSLFLLWEILSSASSGCIGDVILPGSCRPDPLMKTYDSSGREVLSFWDVYSGEHDGELVMTCGYVSNDGMRLHANRFQREDAPALRLSQSIQAGQHCLLARVTRYTGPGAREPSVALPAHGALLRGVPVLEVQKVLPPY